MKTRDIQRNLGNKITVIKIGGKGIGPNGEKINSIVDRVKNIKEKDSYGPVIVTSAPEGITDLAIKVGMSYSNPKLPRINPSCLFSPYINISNNHMKEPHK